VVQLIGGQWPGVWKPRGWPYPDREAFADWWARCAPAYSNLDPRVVEQWVYRHWDDSPYFGFPLQNYRSDLDRIATEVLVAAVGSIDLIEPDPHDLGWWFKKLNNPFFRAQEPERTMVATGTWGTPVLLIRSASGFSYGKTEFPDRSLWLLEGHRRQRYLRALAAHGGAADDHDVLVLTSD
jgi:hypothetical protein